MPSVAAEGFNFIYAKVYCLCAAPRFAKPRSFLKKVLIVAVRSCGCGALIRGLQNLESPCEGERVVTFCVVQKVTKKHAGLRPATSIQISARFVAVVKVTGVHQVTGCAGNCKLSGYRRLGFESVRKESLCADARLRSFEKGMFCCKLTVASGI